MIKNTFLALLAGAQLAGAHNGGPVFEGMPTLSGNRHRMSASYPPVDNDKVNTADHETVHEWISQPEHWHKFSSDKPIYKALWFASTSLPVDIYYVKVVGPGNKGAVFMSVGNTEPVEKHAETIWNLRCQGYSPIYGIDHRGQGRSSRLIKDGTRSGKHVYRQENTYKSHVEDRNDYVVDFRRFVNLGMAQLNPEDKKFIFCHSLGCGVTFMYLIDEYKQGTPQKFHGIAANAPLVQPNTDPFTFWQADWIAWAQVSAGLGNSYPPTLGGTLDEHWAEPDMFNSASTTSYTRWKMQRDLCMDNRDTLYDAGHTGLCVGSATANLAHEMVMMYKDLVEFQGLAEDLSVPILFQQAGQDRTVQNLPMTDFCNGAFSDCTLTVYQASQHNIWWETDAIRNPALNEVFAFFDSKTEVVPQPTTTTTIAPKKTKTCGWFWC